MATSLWELRKRPVAPDAMASPTPRARPAPTTCLEPAATESATEFSPCRYRHGACSRPRTLKSDGSLHSLCAVHRDRSIANQRRFDAKKRPIASDTMASPTPGAPPAPTRRLDPPVTERTGDFPPCQYRRGTCNRPRTLKGNGTLHSLCAVHRDRSIANQRRFDAKKRQLKRAENDAQELLAVEQRKQRREKRRPSASSKASLPSFRAFQLQTAAVTYTSERTATPQAPNPDTTRAWLLPFEVEAAGALVSDVAWRRAAVAQFLHDDA